MSLEFGKFLAYYADAPEIEAVSSKREERGKRNENSKKGKKTATPTSDGYRKLFINLGKKDGFYPGELMQFLNKNIHGHVEVGHIDLLQTMSYFEVPEEEAHRVIKYINGQRYKGRDVRCNDADEGGRRPAKPTRPAKSTKAKRPTPSKEQKHYQKEDWMQFLNPKGVKLKGEVPDFSEEGWAVRKPRKKK